MPKRGSYAKLGPYVESILYDGGGPPDEDLRPFNSGSAEDPPRLRPHGVNHIMLFPGAFNPPHKGHQDLLNNAYINGGADLNIIAAIVLPLDDSRVNVKTMEEKDPLTLPRTQRVELWNCNGTPDWLWIFDGSEAKWRGFRQELEAKARKDKFNLKFILLAGPDIVGTRILIDPACWSCVDTITSNISRPVDFLGFSGHMRQFRGFSAWASPNFDWPRLERQVRARYRKKTKEEIDNAVEHAHAVMRVISVCREHREPRGYIRFVPSDLGIRLVAAPSSSEIRRIIATTPKSELQLSLQGIALNASKLVAFIRANPLIGHYEE